MLKLLNYMNFLYILPYLKTFARFFRKFPRLSPQKNLMGSFSSFVWSDETMQLPIRNPSIFLLFFSWSDFVIMLNISLTMLLWHFWTWLYIEACMQKQTTTYNWKDLLITLKLMYLVKASAWLSILYTADNNWPRYRH